MKNILIVIFSFFFFSLQAQSVIEITSTTTGVEVTYKQTNIGETTTFNSVDFEESISYPSDPVYKIDKTEIKLTEAQQKLVIQKAVGHKYVNVSLVDTAAIDADLKKGVLKITLR